MLFKPTTSVKKHVLFKRLINRWILLWFYKIHETEFISGLNQWNYTRANRACGLQNQSFVGGGLTCPWNILRKPRDRRGDGITEQLLLAAHGVY